MYLRLMSYNIHSGKNIFFVRTLNAMLTYIKAWQPHILTVNEIHNNSRHGLQFDLFQKELNMCGVFGQNLLIADGGYGNAIFSTFPIIDYQNILLPSLREQRGLLFSKLQLPDLTSLTVATTHLSLNQAGRTKQWITIEQQVTSHKERSILTGDFNTTIPPVLPDYVDIGKQAGKDRQPTIFPLRKRLDYIFTTMDIQVIRYEVGNVQYSDHFPLLTEIHVPH